MALTPDEVRKAVLLLDRREAVKRAQDSAVIPARFSLAIAPESCAGRVPDGRSIDLARHQVVELLGAEYAALTARLRQLGVEPGE